VIDRRWLAAALVVATGVIVIALAAGPRRTALWRTVYPHLPRHLQAAPYVLLARVDPRSASPVPLPTALAPQGVDASRALPLPSPSKAVATADAPVELALPPEIALGRVHHEYQTWNNCGPATISMALSYFGHAGGQAAAARRLKPDPNDKNVSPQELARYAGEEGFGAIVRINGRLDLLKRLLALGLPVVVETWFVPEPGDEMGHYRVLTGYSDQDGRFIAADSYNGPEVSLTYEEFDDLWRVFDRVYVVVYPPELQGLAHGAIGEDVDDATMYRAAVQRAQQEVTATGDVFGWFNMGTALLGLGDTAGASSAYDRARAQGLPWRMLWYQHGPFEAYSAEGRWEDVAALAQANLANASNLEESHYWLGRARAARGDIEGARASWQRAQELNPLYEAAAEALRASEAR
jgi:tetratricopeptide (TPR) repeat protein